GERRVRRVIGVGAAVEPLVEEASRVGGHRGHGSRSRAAGETRAGPRRRYVRGASRREDRGTRIRPVGLDTTEGCLASALAGSAESRGELLERLRPRLVLWASARLSSALRSKVEPEDVAQGILLAG